ncbi:MAG: beta-ketoacyl-ACP synthase III [Prevotellaceae bacterium]|jgi:3-oxoacyl-[acyl-carrier-protein] synthase-3|nr:beta-ketoacyl-ACP synthase III [Prevotellaceae bacterium]
MKEIYITALSTFLPNRAVENEDIEKYLGIIDDIPSRAKRLVLKNNGIKTRYYALDEEGKVTHTNVQMAAQAVKQLCAQGFSINDIELLAVGTASPEQLVPSHGVMVHGLLGGKNAETVSFAGSCCVGIQALKYAWLSLLSGEKNNAVCVASERLSAWMLAQNFTVEMERLRDLHQKPVLAFEKEFLRWMLSDGAAALLLQPAPAPGGRSLKIEWIDICSYAHEMETCMYAGGEKNAQGELLGWTLFPEKEWLSRSLFALKQDTRLLDGHIVKLGGRFLMETAKKRNLQAEDIDWFLPHLSSMFFKDKIAGELSSLGFDIPEEKWFLNLQKIGNVASASNFIVLEELVHSGLLRTGQKILLMIPESARFSYGYSLLTVC